MKSKFTKTTRPGNASLNKCSGKKVHGLYLNLTRVTFILLMLTGSRLIGQTITTGTVVGPYCAGSVVSIPYLYTGGTPSAGNVFTAQLSNASGSFASPLTIGTFTSTLVNWTVEGVIPSTIVQGNGYRVRVISSLPSVVGSQNSTNITLYEIYTGNQIFIENCGTISGNTTVAAHEAANGFSNVPFTMTSTATVDLTIGNSTDYTGASGNACLRFQTSPGTFTIANINTTAYSQMGLGFGIRKNSAAVDGSNITIAVSADGVSYSNLSFAPLPTGGGTNNQWYYRVTTGAIPATANLRIRITSTGGAVINIDDMELGNAVAPATVALTPSTTQNICNSSSVTLTATSVANANYLWSNGVTLNTITTSSSGNYSVAVNDLFGCAVSRGPVTVNASSSLTPSVSISSSSGSSTCQGSAVTFTANPVNGGPTPSYQWKLNGADVGTNSPTYVTSSLVNGNTITCVMTSSWGCASPSSAASAGITMTVNARPTASVSGSTTICNGGSTSIAITVTGSGTINGTLNPGAIAFSGTAPTFNVSVSPSATTTYSVASLSDANCTSIAGDLTGTRTVNVNTRPTASVSGSTTICNGGSTSIAITVTGSGTISGTLNPGAIAFSGTAPTINVSVSPSATTTYSVASLSDANCTSIAGDLTGTNVVNVNARPTGVISGTATMCKGGSTTLSIAVTGTGPWSGTLSDATVISGATSPLTVSVSPSANTTYTIATLDDANCTANAGDKTGSTTITVNTRPTGVIGGSQTMCAGSSAPIFINVTGTGTISGTLNPGAIAFSGTAPTINLSVTPGVNTTYTIATMSDANCTSIAGDLSGSAVIVVHPLPTAGISGSTTVCQGFSANISFTGTANAVVTYTINGGSNQTITLDGSGNAILNSGAALFSLNYALVSVNDGVCSTSASGLALITVNDLPESDMTGDTSICGGASTTISFEGTPAAVCTYTINGGPNQFIALNGSGLASFNTGALFATTTYLLVSVSDGTCSQNIGLSVVVTITGNTYYQDSDGDGYGNPSLSLVACIAPVGYILDNTDCCDTNADINPSTEWWGDTDGDGYGSFVYDTGCLPGVTCSSGTWPAQTIPYCPAAHGGAAYIQDCNDSNVAINPVAAEVCANGVDDDCDGVVDDGCSGIVNDIWVNATNLNVNNTNAFYPNCQIYNGTMFNANISPQGNPANVAVGGGRDVWFKFTAPSTAVQIKVAPTGFDAVLELQNSSATQLNVENVNTVIGGLEILNFGSLTVGQTYWVAVRNYHATSGGAFTICVAPMMASGCAYVTPVGGFSLCNTYKALYKGAASYTFNFTGTGGAAAIPYVTTSATTNGLITLSTPSLDMRHGGIYSVRVDANFSVVDGLGAAEPTITVLGNIASANCTGMSIIAQPNIEVKSTLRCPATLIRTQYLIGTPVPGSLNACGAISYTFEFTQVTDCTGAISLAMPFEVTTNGNTPYLMLAAAFPTPTYPLANLGHWKVRIRPNYSYTLGTYGPSQVIRVNGTSLSPMINEPQFTDAERSVEQEISAAIYPNPNNGDLLNLNLTGLTEGNVYIRVMDAIGRTVYQDMMFTEGTLNAIVTFNQSLNAGLYLVEFTNHGNTITEKLLIEK